MIVHDKIYETLLSSPKGTAIWHGYTNTGNPACCAAGLKVLEIVERDGLIENAAKMGKRLHEGLHKLRSSPIVGDIRGLGLMAAVELVRDKQTREAFPEAAAVGAQFRRAALEAGLLIRAIGDSICMSPPLTITAPEIDLLLERLTDALAKTETWARSQKLI